MKKLIILACTALSGCVVSGPYVMPNTDVHSGIHVQSEWAGSRNANSMFGPHIFIVSIDGVPAKRTEALAKLPQEAYVTSGTHTFELRYVTDGSFANIDLALDAQKGHEYIIQEVDSTGAMGMLRFRDGWNGPVVGRLAN